MLLGSGKFDIHLSVPLVLEYEAVAKRFAGGNRQLTIADVDDILDYVCSVGYRHRVYYLWRPFLSDPKDDMVLELAVSASCDLIVTYNRADFVGIEQFGIRTMTAQEFLRRIGVLP